MTNRIDYRRAIARCACAGRCCCCSPAVRPKPTTPSAVRDGQQRDADARRSGRTSISTPSRSPQFHKTVETTGMVDFDNDQATSVLAPFSGPVSRLLVSLGDQVKKGEPLAVVDSPDFAAAVSAYRKALATAQNRAPARRPGQGSARSIKASRSARRSRPRPTPPTPRPTATRRCRRSCR